MKTEIPPTLRRLSRQIADEMDYLDKERFIDETTTPGGDLVSIVAVFRGDEADRMRDVLAPSPPETPAPEGTLLGPSLLRLAVMVAKRHHDHEDRCLWCGKPWPCVDYADASAALAAYRPPASPASAPRETPDPARIALSRQASMVAATVVWLREWVERHAPFCPGGGGCAANCKPIRDALAILSDPCSANPPEAPASAPSGTTGEALRLAAHYIRYGDGQSQDLAGNVSRGRERETVTTRPSRGEALAAVERALSPVESPGEDSVQDHAQDAALERAASAVFRVAIEKAVRICGDLMLLSFPGHRQAMAEAARRIRALNVSGPAPCPVESPGEEFVRFASGVRQIRKDISAEWRRRHAAPVAAEPPRADLADAVRTTAGIVATLDRLRTGKEGVWGEEGRRALTVAWAMVDRVILPAVRSLSPASPEAPREVEEVRPAFMPGGAFCGCGMVEFVVPGVPVVRTHEPTTFPHGPDVVTLHRPGGCRLATEEELRNLDPSSSSSGESPEREDGEGRA